MTWTSEVGVGGWVGTSVWKPFSSHGLSSWMWIDLEFRDGRRRGGGASVWKRCSSHLLSSWTLWMTWSSGMGVEGGGGHPSGNCALLT